MKKNNLRFAVIFSVAFLFVGLLLFLNLKNKKQPLDQHLPINPPSPTIIPTVTLPVQPKLGIMGYIPADTKEISYSKGNSLLSRTFIQKKVGPEKLILTAKNKITFYTYDPKLGFAAATYFKTKDTTRYGEMSGDGDSVDFIDIGKGITKTIFTPSISKNLIATLSFVPRTKKLYLSTDANQIYEYNPPEDKLALLFEPKSANVGKNNFCQGFQIKDVSPNSQYLLLQSRCFEGTIFYVLDVHSGNMSEVGGGYVEGRMVEKFIADGELLGYDYGWATDSDGSYKKYGKYNYQGKLVQEVPAPSESPNLSDFTLSSESMRISDEVWEQKYYVVDKNSSTQFLGQDLVQIEFK